MRATRPLTALLAAALLGACGAPSDPPPKGLAVTITPTSVAADGNSMVTVTVTGDIAYPLSLSTGAGHWEDVNDRSIFLVSINAAHLVTCDSKTTSGCLGTFMVVVSDAKLASGRGNVTFLPY